MRLPVARSDHSRSTPSDGEVLLFLPAVVLFFLFALRGSFLLLFVAGVGGYYWPFGTHKMQPSSTIMDWNELASGDATTFNAAWARFFLAPQLVTSFLRDASVELVHATLAAGYHWEGGGWNTTRAAKVLEELTAVSLVSSQLAQYSHAFLFSLALVKDVEITQLDLVPQAAEAAFALKRLWSELMQEHPARQQKIPKAKTPAAEEEEMDDEEDDEEEVAGRLPWETEEVGLSEELNLVLKRVGEGERLPVGQVLRDIPIFQGLKIRAETNNHQRDARSPQDKFLCSLQQRLLNMCRLQCVQHTVLQGDQAMLVLSQQFLFYLLETERLILQERKRRSIPGTVIEHQHVLFSAEDIKAQKQQQQIAQAGKPTALEGTVRAKRYFPMGTGSRPWRFKPQPMAGKGKGKGQSPWRGWTWRRHGCHIISSSQSSRLTASQVTLAGKAEARANSDLPRRRSCPMVKTTLVRRHFQNQSIANEAHHSKDGVKFDTCVPQAGGGQGVGHQMHHRPPPCDKSVAKHDGQPPVGTVASICGFNSGHVGGCSPLAEATFLSGLVETGRGPPRGTATHQGGGQGRSTPPHLFVPESAFQISHGSDNSTKDPQGVRSIGCYKKDPHGGGAAPCPLVCVFKTRGPKEKRAAHQRLQRAQRVLRTQKVPVGTHGADLPPFEKRMVLWKSRSKRCLFSHGIRRKSARVRLHASRGGVLELPGGLLRDQYPPPKVHVSHAGVGE